MQYRTFGKYKLSRLGLGTVQFGLDYGFTQKLTQSQVDEILNACRRSGVNFLDTARDYGDSEAKIGSYLKRHPGGNWVIATKIKHIPEAICSNERALRRHIITSVRTSAKCLGRPIDILLLHDDEDRVMKRASLWKVIAQLKQERLFREFGVSFYDPKAAMWVLDRYADLVSFIQVPFNVFNQRFAAIFKKADRRGIKIASRSTFLRGMIAPQNSSADPWGRALAPYVRKLEEQSRKASLAINEFALLSAYSTKPIDTVLIGVKSAEEFELNLNALKKLPQFRKFETTIPRLKVKETKLIDPRRWPLVKVTEPVPQGKANREAVDVLVILQARMGSTRLPGKIMKPILGKPMILRQIERVSRAKHVSRFIVATTSDPSDDRIEVFCRKQKILCFRGSVEDVLDRFYKAASLFHPRQIVRITADCPLIDPDLIDGVIELFQMGGYDYVRTSKRFPDGLDVETFSLEALTRAFCEAKLSSEREHVTPYFYKHPEKFKIREYESEADMSDLRWTVDHEADLSFVRKVYKALYPKNSTFVTKDILLFLKGKPEMLKINKRYERNEGYLKSLKQDAVLLKAKRG